MAREIYITEVDRERLKTMIDDESYCGNVTERSKQGLEREIKKAIIVSPQKISRDIVTMNTRTLLQIDGSDTEVSLVYPKDADWTKSKVSVLSPIGTAILGYGKGDEIDWEVPSGTKKIIIKGVLYQPEAAGDFHL